jgi:hypothetical protein
MAKPQQKGGRSGLCAGSGRVFCKTGHAGAQLCTLGFPVGNSVQIKAQTLFLAASRRIKKSDTLNKTAITGFAAVSHGYVIERLLLGTTTRQSNRDHNIFLIKNFRKSKHLRANQKSAPEARIKRRVFYVNCPAIGSEEVQELRGFSPVFLC